MEIIILGILSINSFDTLGEVNMPKKDASINDTLDKTDDASIHKSENTEEIIVELNRMLAAVLNYLADDEVEEIDIDFILDNTDGLRDWWDQYRENNRKQLEEEVRKSLGKLTIEELEKIKEQIKDKRD